MNQPEHRDNFNYQWASALVTGLAQSGVSTFVISPGARSAPLTIAASKLPEINVITHFDERGAAFFALGAAKHSLKPSVLICTSGTAGGNYLPAVMEAYNSETPLIIITADRPPEVHGKGANQTIPQGNIFSDFAVWRYDMVTPVATSDPAAARKVASQAFMHSTLLKGPVHLNSPFREPLLTGSNFRRESVLPTKLESVYNEPDKNKLEQTVREISNSKNGVVAIGQLPIAIDKKPIVDFLKKLNWPCFIDVTSNLRFGFADNQNLAVHSDLFLRRPEWRNSNSPDCVLRIGTSLVSKYLEQYLASCSGPYINISNSQKISDPQSAVSLKVVCDYVDGFDYLNDSVSESSSGIAKAIQTAEINTATNIKEHSDDSLSQWITSYQALTESSSERAFFVGNSLPIREVDATCPVMTNEHLLCANRGVSGIDGLVASACGFFHSADMPGTLILGDTSLLHDLNSLSLVAKAKHPIIIVVNNNDGGAIFSFLPDLRHQAELVDYFQVPHGLSFGKAAEMFGLDYQLLRDASEFKTVYKDAQNHGNSTIIEINLDADLAFDSMSRLWNY